MEQGYEFNTELPADVQSLPVNSQDVYRLTFNASLADRLNDEQAAAEAMRAVALTKAWDESKHPRDPKGTDTGGRWTAFSGLTGTKTWDREKAKLENRMKELEEQGHDSQSSREYDAQMMMSSAMDQVDNAKLSERANIRSATVLDDTDLVAAGVANIDGDTAEISRVGSIKPGAGRAVIESLLTQLADKKVKNVALVAPDALLGYYESFGFQHDPTWPDDDHDNRRMVLTLKKYNPQQPRDPKGVETGGRWVRGGGSADGDADILMMPLATTDDVPEHIKRLYIPPAWADVYFNPDPDGDLLAIGTDAKGRSQYVYSEAFQEGQMRAKFARVSELDKSYDGIRKQVAKDQRGDDSTMREHADVAALVMETGIRPGSTRDRGGDKRAYGATTLEGRHVAFGDNGSVRLDFTGKKGVSLSIPVKDKKMASLLRERAGMVGDKGRLFPNVSDKSLREYVDKLDGGSFSPKDFRTYLGTTIARSIVDKGSTPSSFAAYKRAVQEVGKAVATRLGNTPTVALQSYVDPSVFAGWRSSLIVKSADLWFGAVGKDDYDWRKSAPVLDDPDDMELTPTPADVIAALGFDPKD